MFNVRKQYVFCCFVNKNSLARYPNQNRLKLQWNSWNYWQNLPSYRRYKWLLLSLIKIERLINAKRSKKIICWLADLKLQTPLRNDFCTLTLVAPFYHFVLTVKHQKRQNKIYKIYISITIIDLIINKFGVNCQIASTVS